ncbi:MAG: type II toxin-antitoxin system RelE/ParE family toxin [Defluviitaleaceae bacterium]|nr:type II toxin-antitoxin system RelE/ParE family toxin [Defluviitaleaceae bacterium]MCL2262778.1 type II toxin-antitoxin system RelE/ParE family toxin [Defluviitaleaceae bacterium]
MAREFIMTPVFDHLWKDMNLNDDNLRELQSQIITRPNIGDVIVGTGGARKARYAAIRNTGKSGGARVIYVDITHAGLIFLLYCYPKGKQDDLTPEQKKQVKKIVEAVKGEYR